MDRLAQSLDLDEGAAGAAGYTCESAEYFNLYHVVARVEQFKQAIAACAREPTDVARHFPFTKFFATAPVQPVLKGESFEDDLRAAEGTCVSAGVSECVRAWFARACVFVAVVAVVVWLVCWRRRM